MLILFITTACTIITITHGLPIATTGQGTFIGVQKQVNNTSINYWYGIPYAQQPINQLRWKPPQPLPKSNTTYNANSPNACPQSNTLGIPMTESCLTLNIYAPPNATGLPVYVWIHGGSFTTGAGALFDSGPLVSTSVRNNMSIIVVTINYRLGLLGFMADQALFNERTGINSARTTGNYGILDQMMALQWVKTNIQSFGGDPNQITIGGESAGGISVTILLTSTLVKNNTFQRAIIESGNIWQDSVSPLGVAINASGQFVRTVTNCTSLTCLRNLTVNQLLTIQGNLSSANMFGAAAFPVIDGYVLNDTMENYFARGKFQRVPVLTGSNTNETTLFTCSLMNLLNNPFAVQIALNYLYNSTIVNGIPSIYGSSSGYSSPFMYLNIVFSDSWAHCGARRFAAQYSLNGMPAFLYTFNHIMSPLSACYGVPHGIELTYLFPSTLSFFVSNYTFTPAEIQLSTRMMLHWTSFIRTSNPNYVGNTIPWKNYNTSTDGEYVIDVIPTIRFNYYSSTCTGFWDPFAFKPHKV